jgi:hypothetical protein
MGVTPISVSHEELAGFCRERGITACAANRQVIQHRRLASTLGARCEQEAIA